MNKSLTIVIPAYIEESRILKYLRKIDEYIFDPTLFKVIVVDDGSKDATKDVVLSYLEKDSKNKNCFKLVSYSENRGKGFAVCEGFKHAEGNLILYTDADGASPIKEVEKLLSPVTSEGFDIVCGSRILRDQRSTVQMSLKRRFVGFVFQCILRLLGLASLKDTQCGFKLFTKEVAKKLARNQKCYNYSFDIEYLYLARKFGYKIKEVPINWYHVEGSKISILKDSIKMLVEVLKIKFIYKYN